MSSLVVIVVLFALFWLLIVRPQRNRTRARQELLSTVSIGDEIVSAGGLYGVVRNVDGDELAVEIADGIVVKMARGAVAGFVEPEDPAPEAPEPPGEEPEPS